MKKEKPNSQLMYEWLNVMDKNREKAVITLSLDPVNNISIYTTFESTEEIKSVIKHLLYLLENSKSLINL